MSRYRPKTSEQSGEEVGGLAGWLFTDLLLGLVFVFLAISTPFAISALATTDADSTSTTIPCKPQDKTYYSKSFREPYTDISQAQQVFDDINEFAKREQFPSDKYEVAVALIQGAYLQGERTSAGQERAFNFYVKLSELDQSNFPKLSGYTQRDTRNTKIRFLGAPAGLGESSVPLRGAVVELFFIYDASNC
jgi:hypothetical protein